MELKYNLNRSARVDFAYTIGGILNTMTKFMRSPTYAYKIGDRYTVTREGDLIIRDGTDYDEIRMLVEELERRGYPRPAETDDERNRVIDISITELTDKSFDAAVLDRFNTMVTRKQELLKKAFASEAELKTEKRGDVIRFDWFGRPLDVIEREAYCILIKAMYTFAEKAKHINKPPRIVQNEREAMTCFCKYMGLKGDKYRAVRQELRKRLITKQPERPKPPLREDRVTVICGGLVEHWRSRDDAGDCFYQAMMDSDGAERDMYAKIYDQIIAGMDVCSDEDDKVKKYSV